MDWLPAGTIEAFGLYAVRTSAVVLAAPILGTATGFSGYKLALIVGVSLALYSAVGVPLAAAPVPIEFACFALRELMIGLFLAFTLQAALVAVRVGGELVGHEMGFGIATLVDPNTGVQSGVVTQLYEVFFLLGLLAVDGHHLLLRALAQSFERAPVGSLDLTRDLAWNAQVLLSQTFAAGLSFAAPVIALLAVVSLVVALLARAVPQLNVMEIGFTARIAVGLLAMLAFAPMLAPVLEGLYGLFADGLDAVLEAI